MILASSYVSPGDEAYFFQYLLFQIGAVAICLLAHHYRLSPSSLPLRLACGLAILIGLSLQFQAEFEGCATPLLLASAGLLLAWRNRRDRNFLEKLGLYGALFALVPACLAFEVTSLHLFHLVTCAALIWCCVRHRSSWSHNLDSLRDFSRFLLIAAPLGFFLAAIGEDLRRSQFSANFARLFRGELQLNEAQWAIFVCTYGAALQKLALAILLLIPLHFRLEKSSRNKIHPADVTPS
ncbi:MAG: hypothetical protein RL095_1583 [Verrucomicrobiota bacterium]|jgi:hypothetical protein